MARRPPQMAAFTSWLVGYGDAWEAADADALTHLFAAGASYQPRPFAELVRGRRAMADYWRVQFEGFHDVQFTAQVLGVGDTYGAAHFRVSFRRSPGGPASVRDGILLAALDPRGRCTSLREWSHEMADLPGAD